MQHPIPGSMGRLAEGGAFFDRREILSRAWDLLTTSNLLLLAPRRVGKSSLLNRMKQESIDRGYSALYLSVPDAEDELDFMKRLLRAFRDANVVSGGWVSAFKDALPRDLDVVLNTGLIELRAKQFDWRGPAAELEGLLAKADSKVLLLIDELPLLVGSILHLDQSGRRAERFLLWLKRLREQFQPRWFFAGSIGLDSIARKLRLSGTIHDLQPIELGEFSPKVARAYLQGRGEFYGWRLGSETIDAILEAVEWPIPFHLNLVVEELRAAALETGNEPNPELVERALSRLMVSGRTHFDHWDERLARVTDARFPHYCEVVLGLACRTPEGAVVETIDLRLSQELSGDSERADVLRQVLDLLISDGYLVRQEQRVRFRSALLRRYWREVQG